MHKDHKDYSKIKNIHEVAEKLEINLEKLEDYLLVPTFSNQEIVNNVILFLGILALGKARR